VLWRRLLLGWLTSQALLIGAAAAETGWVERGLSLEATPAPLHGSLVVPAGARDVAGVLLLAGAGPVDRGGNFPGAVNNAFKLLAHALAEHGIASLRVDRRAVAASRAAGPREDAPAFETYVDDAARWLELLQAQPGIGRVFVLGHSDGALVGTLVAERIRPAGLILVAGAGAPAGYDPVGELAKLRAPAIVIQGTHDVQVGEADARRLAGAGPAIELRLIAGMTHALKAAPRDRAPKLATSDDAERPLARQLVPAIVDFIVRH
jgi:pimeloyl-ACP methyl ester carboxylesterase